MQYCSPEKHKEILSKEIWRKKGFAEVLEGFIIQFWTFSDTPPWPEICWPTPFFPGTPWLVPGGASLCTTWPRKRRRMCCGSSLGHSEPSRVSKWFVTCRRTSARDSDLSQWPTTMKPLWLSNPSMDTPSAIASCRLVYFRIYNAHLMLQRDGITLHKILD